MNLRHSQRKGYLTVRCRPILIAILLTFLLYRKRQDPAYQAHYYRYSPIAPHTKAGYTTNTNYAEVDMEAYDPYGEGHPAEYGLITFSHSSPQQQQRNYPDFSTGKITFDPQNGMPNGGTDFIENDTR